jgi:uncharacterized protein YybS (DUF2232 family)
VETANLKEDYKKLVLGITLTSLICALSISIPVIGFIFFLVAPLPVLFYRIRLRTKKTVIIIFCSLACLMFLSGGLSADIFFIAGMLLLGFSMGEFVERNLPVEKIIGYACGVVLFTATFALALYGNISNLGLSRLVSDYIGQNLALTLALYENMGMPEESITMLSNSMEQIRYVLVIILPSFCTAWKSPDYLVWGVIGCALMLMLPVSFFKMLALNGMVVLTIIYFFQGIAIISFYFEKKKIPMAIRTLLYGTIIIQQIFLLVIAGIGFFDVWLNFRRLGSDNNKDKQIPLSS